jgi:hypothetical protein
MLPMLKSPGGREVGGWVGGWVGGAGRAGGGGDGWVLLMLALLAVLTLVRAQREGTAEGETAREGVTCLPKLDNITTNTEPST